MPGADIVRISFVYTFYMHWGNGRFYNNAAMPIVRDAD